MAKYIYLLIFILLAFFSLLDLFNVKQKVRDYCLYFSGFVFVFIAGLRYETGVDWYVYGKWFDSIEPITALFQPTAIANIFVSLDIGFCLLNSIVKALGGNVQVVFLIVSILSVTFLIKGLKYFTRYRLIGLLCYYCFFFFVFDLSGMRQGLALTIFLYSLRYLYERQFLRYLLYILLATSIHWSAIFLLPLYFFGNRQIKLRTGLLMFTIPILIFIVKLRWLANILLLISPLIQNDLITEKLVHYTTESTLAASRSWNLYTIYNLFFLLVIFIIIHFNKERLDQMFKYFNLFYNLFIFQVLIYFSLYEFNEISERLRFYFLISEVILISYLIFLFKESAGKAFLYSFFVFSIFIGCYPFLLSTVSTIAYHPYQNYLFYRFLKLPSDGHERLKEHERTH